jgi:class 3 adenylate cyclase
MRKFTFLMIMGNLCGAFLTFFYFAFIERGFETASESGDVQGFVYFVIATSFIFAIVSLVIARFAAPLSPIENGEVSIHDLDQEHADQLKRRAINLVPWASGITLLAWLLAGFLFGFIQPLILTLSRSADISVVDGLRIFAVTTFVGGSMTTLFVFFATEGVWRSKLGLFFPEGDFQLVKGAFRLSVKTRLLIVFLIVSLIPLTLLGLGSYAKTLDLVSGNPAMGVSVVSSLLKMIVFFLCVGGGAAIALSLLVARSVSEPLKSMESAMRRVEGGDLDVHIGVVSNDEIGAAGEGFNRMIQGLKESESIKESFGKYVSQEIRDEILKGAIPLDGEMRRVTLLFSDLRGFTPFVESTRPQDVVSIMNQYFSEMTEAIKESRGLILQYVGDEIEAVFGAPIAYEDHPDLAIQAALGMRKRLALLNHSLEAQGFKPLRHGIGIHTGAVLAGNIGSRDRVSYTLVGDTVNLASRISGLTKEFSWDIILSQTTHDLLASRFSVERLAPVMVKGKKDAVIVYKLGEVEDGRTSRPVG